MARYALRRILFLVPQLFVVTVFSFSLVHLIPGDPAHIILGPLGGTPANVRALRVKLGLNDPLPVQYFRYLDRTVRGDWGTSSVTQQPVIQEIADRFPPTLFLISTSLILCCTIGVSVGFLAARRPPKSLLNRLITGYGFLTGALPDFWVGLILVFVFFHVLGLLPAPLGELPVGADLPTKIVGVPLIDAVLTGRWDLAWQAFQLAILPVMTLVIVYTPTIIKIAAVTISDTINAPYTAAARAVGVRPRTINRYVLRNALIPILTTSGVLFAFLLGGAVLVETVFSWGGFGQYAVESVLKKDFYPIQGFMLVAATFTIVVYLVVDLLYFAIDPRIRVNQR